MPTTYAVTDFNRFGRAYRAMRAIHGDNVKWGAMKLKTSTLYYIKVNQ